MPARCVAIGGSAGAIEVLSEMLAALPSDLPAPVLAVIHLPPDVPSRLASVLGRRSRLPVQVGEDGAPTLEGHVYLAPPDRHLSLAGRHLAVRLGPRHNRHRPSIDPLLWSVGRHADGGAVGVILSGAPGDGVSGARALVEAGGTVLVQDPRDAIIPAMPERILRDVPGARAVGADALAPEIVSALDDGRREVPTMTAMDWDGGAVDLAPGDPDTESGPFYSCPDCGGVLEPNGALPLRFRCRVGHEYDAEVLLASQDANLEDALWAGVRALEERADLARRVAAGQGEERYRRHHLDDADDARRQASLLRSLLLTRSVERTPGASG